MLKKCTLESFREGFLSPTGEFYSCEYGEHMEVADEIAAALYPDKYFYTPEEELRKQGWAIIKRYMPFRKYFIAFDGHLTSEQIHVIRPVAEAHPDEIADFAKWVIEYELKR